MPCSSPTPRRWPSWPARIGEDLLPGDHGRARQAAPGDDLDPESYRVWSAVPLQRRRDVERLASASGVEPRRLVGILAVLDAEGLVTKHAGGGARHASPPAKSPSDIPGVSLRCGR